MYTPPAFRQDDPQQIAAFLTAHPFGTLVTLGADGLSASPLPFLVETGSDGAPVRLIGHLAKANPQWRDFNPAVPALAVFNGPDAYVTPAWYPSKAETGRVVPTWNYMAVHVHGALEVVEDAAAKLDIVRRLTDRHEGGRTAPWAVSDAPADYVEAQLKGIVGVVLRVERVSAKWKLSQNKWADEYAGVRDGLAAEADPAARLLAAAMKG